MSSPETTLPPSVGRHRSVAVVTLGCARNEVDSEELAGRLDASGYDLVDEPGDADVVLVNTCGFVEAAKKDSIDTLIAASDLKGSRRPQAVVAVGCLAERYGAELADALPEADAVLGFDDYVDIGARLDAVLAGEKHQAHTPRDRRRLLPLQPVERQAAPAYTPGHSVPDLPTGVGPASGPRSVRRRLGSGPSAPVKLASGCDRRCTFCAIPSFRGAFLSRSPDEIVAESRWLAEQGVREVFLVSENSTSYGKDLGDLRSLEALLPRLAAVDGIDWVRVSYLQPAEMRPSLVEAIGSTPRVVPYFDLSFQHASGPVLRRMRRFGDAERFLELLSRVRHISPHAGVRSNVIVGFPGETEDDVAILEGFLTEARLDVVGVFGYSDEDGTEAATYDDKLSADVITDRVARLTALVEELNAQRAEDRIGETVQVLIESVTSEGVEGRAAHQGPDVDGATTVTGVTPAIGDLIAAHVVDAEGVDLVAAAVCAPAVEAHDRASNIGRERLGAWSPA